MKNYGLIVCVLAMFAGRAVHAQSSELDHLLVEVYKDSSFTTLDTANHNIRLYQIRKEKSVESVLLKQHIFPLDSGNAIHQLSLVIDGKNFNIDTMNFRSRFAVMRIYVNPYTNKDIFNLTLNSADVVYAFASCTKCSRIEITNLPVKAGTNGQLTTGYKVLDAYILD